MRLSWVEDVYAGPFVLRPTQAKGKKWREYNGLTRAARLDTQRTEVL